MQPTNARDTRAAHRRIRPRPACGIVGYAAAWAKLERLESDEQLAVLDRLVRNSGFAGPAALAWYAGCLLWEAGLRDYPSAPKSLTVGEVELIERRARQDLADYGGPDVIGPLFPKWRALKPGLRRGGELPPAESESEWATR